MKDDNMFTETITMHIDGADRVLTRINQDANASTYRYRATNLNIDLNVRHTTRLERGLSVNTDRHNVEILVTTYSNVGGITSKETQKVYFVIEMPANQAASSIFDVVAAMSGAFLSEASVGKLVGWES